STLPQPTDSASDIFEVAAALLKLTLKANRKVRLLGVRAANLVAGKQLSLFEDNADKHARLDQTLDAIRERFGERAIRRAALVDDDE
ncbi:MAG: DNA polymerase IV, partial [Chloroflexi bacterium]|nr:DNA polymerase IV [Chloroflexota bacterium]